MEAAREGDSVNALVVEDSTTIRMILRKFLGKLGFDVVEAGNGREGLDRLREMTQTDVVLVDWNMPEMNGIDFVRAVRADHGYDVLPLVMVTTNSELENVAEALSAGANEYVMKPFTLDMIREKMELLGIVKT
jgi:two-component system, chemotaxis family, chemotaxis protein CheY